MRNTEANDGNSTDHHRGIGQRHQLCEPAHAAHVLLMVHAVDNRTGTEEQQRLEEGVGEEVEHRRLISADTCREEHVAELRTGRIGDHALDVVLCHADGGGIERRHRTDERNHSGRIEGILIDRRQEADEIDTCRHHRRRVDQGRHGRRAFHGVRQPDVQEELGRFTHCTNEEQDADQLQCIDALTEEHDHGLARRQRFGEGIWRDDRVGPDRVQHRGELNRAEHEEDRHDAEGQTKVTHPVRHERLDGSIVRRLLRVPEADQQVGGEAHAFPAKEQLDEVVCHHEHQHHESEQRQVSEETRLVRVLAHVAPGIEVHEAGDTGDHRHHDDRQCIYTDGPVGLEIPDVNPWHQRDDALLQFHRRNFRTGCQVRVIARRMVHRFRRAAETGHIGEELVE